MRVSTCVCVRWSGKGEGKWERTGQRDAGVTVTLMSISSVLDTYRDPEQNTSSSGAKSSKPYPVLLMQPSPRGLSSAGLADDKVL